jgi:serine protease Do
MTTRSKLFTAPLALVAVLVFRASAVAQTAAAPQSPAVRGLAGLAELSRSLEQLVERISPSVVQVFVTGYAPPDEDTAATSEPSMERSSGSGVILDPDGYIITNAHVVEYATRLEVELPLAATGGLPGRSIVRRRGRTVGAQVVAIDHETDLAVIKVEAKGLPALPIGDSDTLRPGELVLAFGSPLGLDSSVSMGVVSAVARQLTADDPMIYVQTDAPINPGSSGGALVDTEGRLVGINTLIYSQSGGNEGIGFAAPSNIVRNVFTQIRKTGRVRRGEIGVYPQTVTPLMAEALKLSPDAGVILSDVTPGGPAAKAGLLPGDVVLSLDGKRMENGRQFRVNLYTRNIGDQVTLDVQRGERRVTARVAVTERDSDVGRLADFVTPQNTIREIGVFGVDLNAAISALLDNVRGDKGVVVALVGPGTPLSQQGRLAAGDVIYAVNGRAIDGVERLKAALAALPVNAPFVLQVEREGTLLFLSFKVER